MKKTKPIYLLSPDLKWKAFKALQDKLVHDSGPTPVGGEKMLWQLLKEKRIYCWFDPYEKDDMGLGLKLPKGRKIEIIANYKK